MKNQGKSRIVREFSITLMEVREKLEKLFRLHIMFINSLDG